MPFAGAVHPLDVLEAKERVGDEAAVPGVVRSRDLVVAIGGARLGLVDDAPVGAGELPVAMQRPRRGDRQIHLRRRRPLVSKERLDVPDAARNLGNDRIAVLRIADGKAQHVAQRERAVVAQHCEPAAECTRYDRCERSRAGYELEAELVAVPRDRRRAWCRSLGAEHHWLAAGRPQDRRQVATRPVQVRLDDLEGEAGRDGGIEGIAALLEHRHAGRRREPVRRRDHAEPAAELRASRDRHASGTSHTAPSGGSVNCAENGWSCHGKASASTPPMFPTPEPP